jgi:phospholipid/cholesterol/gamma-HCH transport system substrate-binding protein
MGRLLASIGAFLRRFGAVVVGLVVVAALVAVVLVVTTGGSKTYHLTAYFQRTVGLYTGNDVRILGVKVGHIDSITPDGSQVKVVMTYDADNKVPANAKAVIITPSIVSDRYVQLTPGYTSGPTMADNAVLQIQDTRVPLELDQIFGNLNQLNVALGPKGANKKGALSRLIQTGAANLRGNGGHFNQTLREFSAAISTLAGSRGDLFATVNHLQSFTTTLANNDGGVRQLNSNLAKVGGQLAGERKDLGVALANLSTALSAVNNFVATNRNTLTGDIHGLANVTNVLTKEQDAIKQFTDLAPLGLSNLGLSYDPEARTLDTKSDSSVPFERGGPSGAVCQLLHTIGLDVLLPSVNGCGTSNSAAASVQPGSKRARSLTGLLGVGR